MLKQRLTLRILFFILYFILICVFILFYFYFYFIAQLGFDCILEFLLWSSPTYNVYLLLFMECKVYATCGRKFT